MKKLMFPLLMLFAGAAYAADVSVAGKWNLHSSVGGNESDQTCTIMQTGKVLSGFCVSAEKVTVKLTGAVDGDKVTLSYMSDYNGTPLTIKMTGKLASGKISGDETVDPFGVSGDFTATPAK